MDSMKCRACGGDLVILQQGYRTGGTFGPADGAMSKKYPIETVAQCQNAECRRMWCRAFGDQGEWEPKA
jgi:hypothetical protein